jgi:hypothetical protein
MDNYMWSYNGQEFSDDFSEYIGFVYLITNTTNDRKYIGKKQFFSINRVMRTVKLKSGIKKRKKVTLKTESNWKDYYGSSHELLADIELLGIDKFKREILYLCKTLGTLSYIEARYQMDLRVLESDEYYNGQIQCRVHKNHLKL